MSVAPVDFDAPVGPPPSWFPAAARRFAGAPAGDVLAWAVGTFGPALTVACSMQDAVLVDLAVRPTPAWRSSSSTPAFTSPRHSRPPDGLRPATTSTW